METKCPIVETQTCADSQSDRWSDDEEEEGATDEKVEVMKKGATPFSSKATPSTTTTPFSRKKTPVKNNYGKNRRAMQSSSLVHDNDDDFKSIVQHGQKVQSSRAKDVSSSKKRHACRASPSSPKIALKLSSSKKKKRVESPLPLSPRIENGKAKSAKKAHKCESKHKIKAKPPRRQKSPSHSQASKEESMQSSKVRAEQKNSNDHVSKPAMNQKVTKKTDTAPRLSQPSEAKPSRTKKSESVPPQRSERKRDQSTVNVEKNPRRSKRLKESTRAEKAAAALKTRAEQAALKTQKKKTKAAKAKQVTPLDGGARQSQSKVTSSNFQNQNPPLSRSNDDDHLDTDLHVYPANDDVDQLLGTSIVVDTSVGGGGDSSSSGLDPDDGLVVDKPKAKLFTPFRAGDKKSKKKYGRKSNKSKKAAVSMNAGKNKAQKPESVFSFKINW